MLHIYIPRKTNIVGFNQSHWVPVSKRDKYRRTHSQETRVRSKMKTEIYSSILEIDMEKEHSKIEKPHLLLLEHLA